MIKTVPGPITKIKQSHCFISGPVRAIIFSQCRTRFRPEWFHAIQSNIFSLSQTMMADCMNYIIQKSWVDCWHRNTLFQSWNSGDSNSGEAAKMSNSSPLRENYTKIVATALTMKLYAKWFYFCTKVNQCTKENNIWHGSTSAFLCQYNRNERARGNVIVRTWHSSMISKRKVAKRQVSKFRLVFTILLSIIMLLSLSKCYKN